MVFVLVSAPFSFVSLINCTQKTPLFDLESPTKYPAESIREIQYRFVTLVHKFRHRRIWPMEFGRPPVDQDYSDPGFCPEMANYYFFIYYFFLLRTGKVMKSVRKNHES